jgi:hypothetical protein
MSEPEQLEVLHQHQRMLLLFKKPDKHERGKVTVSSCCLLNISVAARPNHSMIAFTDDTVPARPWWTSKLAGMSFSFSGRIRVVEQFGVKHESSLTAGARSLPEKLDQQEQKVSRP